MEFTVLTGDDEQKVLEHRRSLADRAGGGLEVVDCAQEPQALIDALGSPSLFGGQRFVWADNLEALGDSALDDLEHLAGTSGAVVVARAGSLAPRARNRLKAVATVVSCALPRGKGVAVRIDEMVRSAGLVIDSRGRRLLLERTGHDLDRLASVLRQCELLELLRPTPAQLGVLVGSSAAPGVPWDLGDAIERGDAERALAATGGLSPIPAHAYLSKRFLGAAVLAEANCASVDQAMELIDLKARFQAEKVLDLSRRLGVEKARLGVQALARFDRELKSGRDQRAVFDQLVVELSVLCV